MRKEKRKKLDDHLLLAKAISIFDGSEVFFLFKYTVEIRNAVKATLFDNISN
jgi:hypothetical protein